MKKNQCKLCTKHKLDFTSPGSNNKAEIFMQSINLLTFYGDDTADYKLKCNYCPKCGKKLIIYSDQHI